MMRRWPFILIFCSVLGFVNIVGQDDVSSPFPPHDPMQLNKVQPLVQIGWGRPYDIAWMPDGEYFAVATGAGVWFYNANDLSAEPRLLDTTPHAPHVIAISPDGSHLATGGVNAQLWDIDTGSLLEEMNVGFGVGGLGFSSDGSQLAVTKGWGSRGFVHGIFLYNTQNGRQQSHLVPDWIFEDVQFLPDGKRLFVRRVFDCCGEGMVIDLQTGEVRAIPIDASAFTLIPDEERILAYNWVSGFYRFDLNTEHMGMPTETPEAAGNFPELVSINDGEQFISFSWDGELSRWDSHTFERLELISTGFPHSEASFSPDGSRIVAVAGGNLRLFDTSDGSVIEERHYRIPDASLLEFVGEELIAFSIDDHDISLWNLRTLENQSIFEGHEDNITVLEYDSSRDPSMLYSASRDGTIRAWNIANGETYIVLDRSGLPITAMALGDEGELYIATCSASSGTIERYDREQEGPLRFSTTDGEAIKTRSVAEIDFCLHHLQISDSSILYKDWRHLYIRSNSLDVPPDIFSSPLTGDYRFLDEDNQNVFAQILIARGTAIVWDRSQEGPYVVVSHANEITAMASIGDNHAFVSAACAGYGAEFDGTPHCYGAVMTINIPIQLYEVPYVLIGHNDVVRQLRISPEIDPTMIASVSDDGTIIIWGTIEGEFDPIRIP